MLRLSRLVAKRRRRILLRLTDNYISITIINSAWFFKIEYEVGDSGPCRVTCRRMCAVLWGGAVPRRSDKVKAGLIDIALAALNYSRIYYVYNIYGGINRGINRKEGAILRYFDVHN